MAARRKKPSNPAKSSGEIETETTDERGSVRKRSQGRKPVGVGDELGAAELTRRVAEALKRSRRDRQLSLDDLSARSGVSRAALSQIEGGKTNPTLAVLWKVAVGLEIPFHDLLGSSPEAPVLILKAGDTPPLRTADGRTESRLLSPGGSGTDTEVYDLRLAARALHKSDAHARGTAETLIVLTGVLRLHVESATYDLSAGDSAFFRADVAHAYENRSTRETRCINVIHYVRH